jgi:hypothetical protein
MAGGIKMSYKQMDIFLENTCKMPGHWCNGEPIPEKGRRNQEHFNLTKQAPCPLYRNGCRHPKHPKFKGKVSR